MSRFKSVLTIAMALLPATIAGAQAPAADAAVRPGIVICCCGVGRLDCLGPAAQVALPLVGVKHEVREFVWSHGFGQLFKDLQDSRHLARKAEELADIVRKLKDENPERPVYLIGKSGGTGLVLATADRLPAGTLERVILLSAAVSPEYDLRPALRATRQGIVSFHSAFDQFILGWGTWQFGTMDRVYGPSAGLNGFLVPDGLDAVDRALYSRLVQVPWHPRMLLQGHPGNHAGTSFPTFLAVEVAPWLR